MKGFRVVFLKELRRFFTDRRMLIALFLPGVLIFVLYNFLGTFLNNSVNRATTVTNSTYVVAYSDNCGSDTPVIVSYFSSYVEINEPTNSVKAETYTLANLEDAKQKVLAGEYDVLIAFSDDFETKVLDTKNNHIDFYYDGGTKKSSAAYSILVGCVSVAYDNYWVNMGADGTTIDANIAGSDFLGAQIMSIIFPMVTTSLLFSTVVSICPDSVAGEKERGTMSSMLLTPVKRRDIALGKAMALIVTSIASGLVSFIGISASIPRLMAGSSFYLPAWGYTLLALLVVSTLILFVSVGLLVSTLGKSTKEVSSYLGPLTVIFLVVAIIPAIVDTTSIGFAFVPFLNIVSCMSTLLTGQVPVAFFCITIGVSALVAGILIFVITKLFESEKVMVK